MSITKLVLDIFIILQYNIFSIKPSKPLNNAKHWADQVYIINKMNSYANINDDSPLDYNNLIEFLKNKNLVIDDETKAKSYLLTIGYSRLKRYFKVFCDNNSEKFIDNFSFEDLLKRPST